MSHSPLNTTTSSRGLVCSAMVIIVLSMLVLSGCQVREAPTKLREERNFVFKKTPSRANPAIPYSSLDVTSGTLAVSINGEKHELETLTVTPQGKGPFPLAVISHGNSRNQRRVQLTRYQRIAEDFAERGYKAVVFARRGAASSTGDYVDNMWGCRHLEAGRTSAEDYAAVIKALTSQPDIDRSTIIAAGQSGGGFAVLALASQAPSGLVGVVNFAGGRGGNRHDERHNCNEFGFVSAFAEFGKTAHVPSLWLYSTADHFFWPDLVKRGFAAYAKGGAPVRLEWFGPLMYAEDGHRLYRGEGQYLWSPRISDFLKAIGAPN